MSLPGGHAPIERCSSRDGVRNILLDLVRYYAVVLYRTSYRYYTLNTHAHALALVLLVPSILYKASPVPYSSPCVHNVRVQVCSSR